MGIAYAGGRPVAEIQFCDYGFNTIDLLKVAGNQRWAGAGNYDMPIVADDAERLRHPRQPVPLALLRELGQPAGRAGRSSCRSNALDAYGLMLSAIADPNPVMVLLPKALLRVRGEQLIPGEPDDEDELKEMIDAPVGDRSQLAAALAGRAGVLRAARRRRPWSAKGRDATVVSYGRTLPLCVQAADQLRDEHGLSVRRASTCAASSPTTGRRSAPACSKTGRVLIVNEDTEVTNFGEHLLRRVIDEHFYDLLVRPRVLLGKHVPGIGLNQVYEQNTVPQLAERPRGDAGGRHRSGVTDISDRCTG